MSDRKTIEFDIDISAAKDKFKSLSNLISNDLTPVFERVGAGAAVAGMGYLGYQALTSENSLTRKMALGTGKIASTGARGVRSSMGLTPTGMTTNAYGHQFSGNAMWRQTPEGYTGRNMMGDQASYVGRKDIGQRASASMIAAGSGTANLALAGGASYMAYKTGAFGLNAIGSSVAATGASGAVKGAAGLGAGALNTLGLPGGSAVKGVGGVMAGGASTAGGLLGGLAGTVGIGIIVSKAVDNITEKMVMNVAMQRNIEDTVERFSRRITPGDATNALTGVGIDYQRQAGFAHSAREDLVGERFMRQGDFDDIFSGMEEADMMFDVRGVDELSERFSEVSSKVLDVARFYETTLKDATNLMGQMQQAGIYDVADQAGALIRAETMGRMTGLTGQEMVGVGMSGAQTAWQHGIDRSAGYDTATQAMLRLTQAEEDMGDSERQDYLTNIQRMGGQEQVAGNITGFTFGAMEDRHYQAALFGLFNEDMEIDQNRWSDLHSGDMTMSEAIKIGGERLDRDGEAFQDFKNNIDIYTSQLNENGQLLEFVIQMLQLEKNQKPGVTMDTILSQRGLDNAWERGIFQEVMDVEYDPQLTIIQERRDRHREEMARDRSWEGLKERIAHPFSRGIAAIANNTVTPIHEGISGFIENLQESYMGISRTQLSEERNLDLTAQDFIEGYNPSSGRHSDLAGGWDHDTTTVDNFGRKVEYNLADDMNVFIEQGEKSIVDNFRESLGKPMRFGKEGFSNRLALGIQDLLPGVDVDPRENIRSESGIGDSLGSIDDDALFNFITEENLNVIDVLMEESENLDGKILEDDTLFQGQLELSGLQMDSLEDRDIARVMLGTYLNDDDSEWDLSDFDEVLKQKGDYSGVIASQMIRENFGILAEGRNPALKFSKNIQNFASGEGSVGDDIELIMGETYADAIGGPIGDVLHAARTGEYEKYLGSDIAGELGDMSLEDFRRNKAPHLLDQMLVDDDEVAHQRGVTDFDGNAEQLLLSNTEILAELASIYDVGTFNELNTMLGENETALQNLISLLEK